MAAKLYRAAVNALREGDWHRAATHLLTLVFDEQDLGARGALVTLEKAHPGDYWRAAFDFALERGAWDHAASALARLGELATPSSELAQLHEQLQTARASGAISKPRRVQEARPGQDRPDINRAGVVLPLRPNSLQSQPKPSRTAVAAPPEEFTFGNISGVDQEVEPKSISVLLRLPGRQAAKRDRPLPPDTFAPPRFEDQPTSPGHAPPSLPEVNTPSSTTPPEARRVLKSVAFGDDDNLALGVSTGPVYNTLGEPRALKLPTFLQADLPKPNTEDTPSLPHAPPAEPSRSSQDTPPHPQLAVAFGASPVQGGLPEDLFGEHWDAAIGPSEDTIPIGLPTSIPQRRPPDRLGRLLIAIAGLLVVLVLGIGLALRAQSDLAAVADTIEGAQQNAPQPEHTGEATDGGDELTALIGQIDAWLQSPNHAEASARLRDSSATVLRLTEEKSPLRTALLAWIEAGAAMLAADARAAEACATSDEQVVCTDARLNYQARAAETHLARQAVCLLVPCPTLQ